MVGRSTNVGAGATVPTSELTAALAVLRRHGIEPPSGPDAVATGLMDLYRRTGKDEVFEVLIALSREQLLRRVRSRTRFYSERVDAEELLQDAVINIYRYPDKFDGSRPGAFRAWSSMIVDNAVRRHMRRATKGPEVRLRPIELLAEEPDKKQEGPSEKAMVAEVFERVATAFRLFLSFYLSAYQGLSERDRFVLQMVEVEGMRYAQLSEVIGLRPEALKMVVFRGRKRIFARVAVMLSNSANSVSSRRTARSDVSPAGQRLGRGRGLKAAV